jgi:hypothetical protein
MPVSFLQLRGGKRKPFAKAAFLLTVIRERLIFKATKPIRSALRPSAWGLFFYL